ncbi:Tissue factor pathway inhibitor 2 [Mactra antiquata]
MCLLVNWKCIATASSLETIEECQGTCGSIQCPVCNLPKAKGPCKALLPRWYFDVVDCMCKKFRYGGCGGNLNRFMTKSDCEGSCGSYECPVCKLDKKIGPCRAAINRWYYDMSAETCLKFSWSGCQSNGNNFKTRRLCNKVCKGFTLG